MTDMNELTGIRARDRVFPCKGVVFDKDGTLTDIFPMLYALGQERHKHLCSRVPRGVLSSLSRCTGFDPATGKVEPFGPIAAASRNHEVVVAATALWLEGVPWYKAIRIANDAYDAADLTLDPRKAVRLLDGAEATLRALHGSGLRLAIATSDQHGRTVAQLDALGVLDLFSAIVAADDVIHDKPYADPVLRCAELVGADPRDLVVVGDSPQDMLMGKSAGARTIGLLSGVSPPELLEQMADVVVNGIADISVIS